MKEERSIEFTIVNTQLRYSTLNEMVERASKVKMEWGVEWGGGGGGGGGG